MRREVEEGGGRGRYLRRSPARAARNEKRSHKTSTNWERNQGTQRKNQGDSHTAQIYSKIKGGKKKKKGGEKRARIAEREEEKEKGNRNFLHNIMGGESI